MGCESAAVARIFLAEQRHDVVAVVALLVELPAVAVAGDVTRLELSL